MKSSKVAASNSAALAFTTAAASSTFFVSLVAFVLIFGAASSEDLCVADHGFNEDTICFHSNCNPIVSVIVCLVPVGVVLLVSVVLCYLLEKLCSVFAVTTVAVNRLRG